MMCRTSIFALLAAAMTFAAEGVTTTVNANVDSLIDSVTVTAGSQTLTLDKNSNASWMGWVVGTAYSVAATGVATGYTAKWKVSTNNVVALSGGMNNTITLSSTTFYGCTLSFYGEPNTYAVTLDRQSGSGGSSSVTATYGSAMPAITKPSRTGYTFGGYYTGTDGSGTQYYTSSGASAKNWDEASVTTLYAKWTANTYTVTLDKQGGSGGRDSVTATYNAQLPQGITMPTRTGYTNGGYYTGRDGTGTQYYSGIGYSPGGVIWNTDSGGTLYAKWTARTFTVNLDRKGGEGGTTSLTATYDQAMPAITRPSRTGYTFGGYYTGSDGSGTQYYTSSGASAKNWDMASATTLYAKWTAKTYALKVNTGGGVINDDPGPVYTFANRVLKTGSAQGAGSAWACLIPKAARTGYDLAGYYDASSGGEMVYDGEGRAVAGQYWTAPYVNTSNCGTFKGLADSSATALTVYARWTPKTFTVTFDANGGSVSPDAMTVTYGSTYGNLPTPTLADHSFAGWFTAQSGGEQVTSSTSVSITGNQTLYARWAQESYEVQYRAFDKNGELIGGNYQMIGMGVSTYLTAFNDLNIRLPDGYSFKNWNTAQDGSAVSYEDHANVFNLTNVANTTVTLYAQWEPNSYEVAFQPNGADGGETMTNQSFIYDVPQPLNAVAFTYTGHAFENWSSDTNHNYQTEYYLGGAVVTNLATGGVVNLYANWTGIVYTVSFDANGGTGTMTNMTCTYNVPTNLPYCTFERDGWGFKGWTNSLAEGVLFGDHARVTNLTTQAEEVQMYACWTGVTYSVVFDTLGKGVMTNGEEEVSVLTKSYVVGDAWDDFPVPSNVDTQHWVFACWTYVDAQGETKPIPAEVPPPSAGATNLVSTWSWKVDVLAAAVDATNLAFSTFGTKGSQAKPVNPVNQRVWAYSADWFAQTNFVHGSTNAVQSGALPVETVVGEEGFKYVSWLTTTVEGKGVLSFWWKCDAEPMYDDGYGVWGDNFRFGLFDSTNGITNVVAVLTNHVDWSYVVYTNESDTAVSFAWAFIYEDDGVQNSACVGGGAGWVDRVTWTPDGSSPAEETPTYKVPYSWLRANFPAYESADADSLNALGDGESPIGKPMKVGEEYWAGTDPNDPDDLFRAYIAVSNDVARITWLPDLSVTGVPVRVYHVLCAPTPSAGWTVLQSNVVERLEVELPVTDDSGTATNRFFKVELDWEESQKN